MTDKSKNKVQFRQMTKSIQKISAIGISFGYQPIANFFHDQTICIADSDNLTIGNSLGASSKGWAESVSEVLHMVTKSTPCLDQS